MIVVSSFLLIPPFSVASTLKGKDLLPRSRVYKKTFMLNSAEHEILNAKKIYIKKFSF